MNEFDYRIRAAQAALKCNDQIRSFQSVFQIYEKFLYYHHLPTKLYTSFKTRITQGDDIKCITLRKAWRGLHMCYLAALCWHKTGTF